MKERTGIITFGGNPMTLLGEGVSVGQKAPDFTVLTTDLEKRSLADYKGKVVAIYAAPSLDTGICDMQTRWFNEEAAKLGDDVQVLAISCDLPFAQGRWCGAHNIHNVATLSDHYDVSFGQNYGVLIKELRLLTRSMFVIDKEGTIVYTQIVPEVTTELEIDAPIEAIKKAL